MVTAHVMWQLQHASNGRSLGRFANLHKCSVCCCVQAVLHQRSDSPLAAHGVKGGVGLTQATFSTGWAAVSTAVLLLQLQLQQAMCAGKQW